MTPDFSKLRIAVVATHGFEESELTSPVEALKKSGIRVDIISPEAGEIQGFKHHDKSLKVKVDRTLDEAQPSDYRGVVLPGGALNADALRMNKKAQDFVRHISRADLPIAAICHAPWLLVSAGLVRARTLTSCHSIQDDIRNADGNWVDKEVCLDETLLTSRMPKDLPAFNRMLLKLLEAQTNKASSKAA